MCVVENQERGHIYPDVARVTIGFLMLHQHIYSKNISEEKCDRIGEGIDQA
jgi:hypothetical protein